MPLLVTVTPSVAITDNTLVTAAVLNLLGAPVVDIQGSVDGTSGLTVADGTITNAKLAPMTGPKVKGREEVASGAVEDLTLDTTLAISGGVLKVANGGITATQLAPGAVANPALASASVGLEKLTTQNTLTVVGNASADAASVPEPIALGPGLAVIANASIATASRSRTSGKTTIITAAPHGIVVAAQVNVVGMTDPLTTPPSTFNAFNVLASVISPTSFSYTNAGPDVASNTDTFGLVRLYGKSTLEVKNSAFSAVSDQNQNSSALYSTWTVLPTWGGNGTTDQMKPFQSAGTDWTVSFQPKLANSSLLIELSIPVYNPSASNQTGALALFRDATNNAVAAIAVAPITTDFSWTQATLRCTAHAFTTDPTTFKVKYSGAGLYFNGNANTGGVTTQAVMRVTELPA